MFDTERLTFGAWSRALADFGYRAAEEVYLRSVGLTTAETNRVLRAAYGPAFLLEATNDRTSQYVREEVAQRGVPLKPGLLPLLDYLESKGLARAVASSSSRNTVDRLLSTAGLLQRFDATVAGDEVAQGKPAPDIFLHAASLLGQPASRCLVLEDSEAGARAAVAAGMACIVVPDLRPPAPEVAALAAAVLPDLNAVRAWLAALPAGQGVP